MIKGCVFSSKGFVGVFGVLLALTSSDYARGHEEHELWSVGSQWSLPAYEDPAVACAKKEFNVDGQIMTGGTLGGWVPNWHYYRCLPPPPGDGRNWRSTNAYRGGKKFRLSLVLPPDAVGSEQCPSVGNPIGVAGGNKIQRDVDWQDPLGLMTFARWYNHATRNRSPGGWRHRYLAQLSALSKSPDEPEIVSGAYATSQEACQKGASDIAAVISKALGTDDWEATHSDGRCRLVGASGSGPQPYAEAVVFDDRDRADQPPELVQLYRPNGTVVAFGYSNGEWEALLGHRGELQRTADDGWIYETDRGDIEHYDAGGTLLSLTLAGSRHRLSLSYDSNGRLALVKDQLGRELGLAYSQGRLASVTTPTQDLVTFSYDDTNGQLTQATYPDGSKRIYHYEDGRFPDALTGITDEDANRFATWSYDDQGRAVVSEHADGAERTMLDYHDDGSVTVTNPLGKETTYHFTTINGVRRATQLEGHPSAHCAAANRSYTYTPEGWIESKTDWKGNTTTYDYNDRGLVTRKVEATGTPEERVTTRTWHPGYRLPDVVTEPDRVIDNDYDAQGRLIAREIRATN